MNWWTRLWPGARRRAEAELDEELRFHLEMEAELHRTAGCSPEEARRRARRDLGGVERTKEDTRDAWAGRWLADAGRDLRLAGRWLRRQPGFTAVAVGTIALAIGANAAVFGAVHGALLAPLPYPGADRLVFVWHRYDGAGSGRSRVTAPDAAAYREGARTLQDLAFVGVPMHASVVAATGADDARIGISSGNLFRTLGVEAQHGRVFGEGETAAAPDGPADPARPAAAVPVVMSHGYWQRRFGGRADVLGETIRVHTHFHYPGLSSTGVVVGVLPPSFELRLPASTAYGGGFDLWFPVPVELDRLRRGDRAQDQDTDNTGVVIARLAPGASAGAAQRELRAIAAGPEVRGPGTSPTVDVVDYRGELVRAERPALLLLQVAVGIVLLIACLNLVSLLLARALHRERDFALRSVLGATRERLIRQTVVEGALLAALGGVAGIGIGGGLMGAWAQWGAVGTVGGSGLEWSPAVVGYLVTVTGVVALVVGLVPAFLVTARTRQAAWGRGLVRRGGSPGGRVREALVAVQIGLTVALMTAAGLLARSFAELQQVDPGFETQDRVAFDITLSDEAIGGPGARAGFMADFRARLLRIPRVWAVGVTGSLPWSGRPWTQPFGFDGEPPGTWDRNEANFRVVTSDYLPTLGVRLLAGRHFTPAEDRREDGRVVIVDATLADRMPGAGSPLGKRLGIPLDGDQVWAEVVGIVEPVRHESLRAPGRPTLYVPYRQEATRAVSVVLHTASSPETLGPTVRAVLTELGRDTEFPVRGFRRLEADLAEETAPVRLAMQALGAFAGLTVLLAAVGLYGVIAYDVGRRRFEIGLRLAIGATRGDVVRRTLFRTVLLAGLGIGLGLTAAASGARLLQALLVNVAPWDPAVFGGAALLFAVVAGLAGAVPAFRAARVDPMVALRAE